MRSFGRISFFLSFCIVLSSCSSIRLDENIEDFRSEIATLERQLLADPQSDAALSDLGSIDMRTGYPVEASESLQRAYALGKRDPKTLFFLGLANEELGKTQTALRLYELYAEVSTLSPYRSLMQGRYVWLVREAAHEELRMRLAEEEAISDS